MNVFEDEDYKPPWKVSEHKTEIGRYPSWDIVPDRTESEYDYYRSVINHATDNEKLCKLWAASPKLVELIKKIIKAQHSSPFMILSSVDEITEAAYLIRKIGL